MGKKEKKKIRAKFRSEVFRRDHYACLICGASYKDVALKGDDEVAKVLNAHHITDRSLMPAGGYVLQNGISVCEEPCHLRVEQFHIKGVAEEGLHPDDLYEMIGSSKELAIEMSLKLNETISKHSGDNSP